MNLSVPLARIVSILAFVCCLSSIIGRAVKAESMAPASSKLWRLLGEGAHQLIRRVVGCRYCEIQLLISQQQEVLISTANLLVLLD